MLLSNYSYANSDSVPDFLSIKNITSFLQNEISQLAIDSLKPNNMTLEEVKKQGKYNPSTNKHDLVIYEYVYTQYFGNSKVEFSFAVDSSSSPITSFTIVIRGNSKWYKKFAQIVENNLESEGIVNNGQWSREKFRSRDIVVVFSENSFTNVLNITVFQNSK